MPASIVILISGRGSNMLALARHGRDHKAVYSIASVLSDQPDAQGLVLARDMGLCVQAVPAPKGIKRTDYDRTLAAAIDAYAPQLIVLAGFMRILSPEFVAQFSGKILNIHPSLLPKYPGLHTHRRALEARDAEHGVTVHFVTEQLDGGPAVIQGRVPVAADESEGSLAARVQQQEHRIYPIAVDWFCSGRLKFAEQRAWLDGRVLSTPVQYLDEELPSDIR